MNAHEPADLVLPNALLPISLVKDAAQLGGSQVDDCLFGDLVIRNGQALELRVAAGADTIAAAQARLVLPKLTECHVHLDKCHTISRITGVGGDLLAAIEQQEADKANWTNEDVRERATRGLDELISAGCGLVRSHVDWIGEYTSANLPHTFHILSEIGQDCEHRGALQLSPLIGIDQYERDGFAESVARQLVEKCGVLGGFVFDQENRKLGIEAAVKAADRFGLALDFHVDEGLQPGLDGLELIADAVIELGFEGPVLCGHACSLMNLDSPQLTRGGGGVLQAGIAIASLPVTNLYLQGRTGGTPDRRGITRISELRELGVQVAIGTDNVRDAFCPLGRHDPMQSLNQASLAAHLDPPFGDHLPLITIEAERALGVSSNLIDGAKLDQLIAFDAASTSELLAHPTKPKDISTLLQGETA